MDQFDYVIIGAGSAGCVLADRLSVDGKARVLVVERGPRDRSPWIQMPAGYGKLYYHPHLNYGYHSQPEEALNVESELREGSGCFVSSIPSTRVGHFFFA